MTVGTAGSRRLEFFAFGFALALLAVALGLWAGLLLWPARTAHLPGLDQLNSLTSAREAENQALQNRIDALRTAVQGNVCVLPPGAIAPLGTVNKQAPVPPAALPAKGARSQPFSGNLADLLDQATVLVIAFNAKNPDELEEGSGFFIAPDTIVTNNHVIADSESGKIFVFDSKLGKPLQASLLASTGTSTIGGPDYAVLGVPPQSAIQPLALTSSVQQLQPVIAAGFPAATEQQDRTFTALLQGKGTAMPPVILTDGRISAIQTSDSGYRILPHTAQISKGNSGGPLVDQCGRVVGIDTFESGDEVEAVHLNYALEAAGIAAFLQAHQIPLTLQATPCTGQGGAAP